MSPYSSYELGYEDVSFTSSPNQDADKACAGFVEQYNAFGILTNDTDFLIHQFSPDVAIFSIRHLDMENLNTKVYDKQKLADFLGLRMNQLPLFATLKGNDLIHFKDLSDFHRSLMNRPRGFIDAMDVIPKLAQFIKSYDMQPEQLAMKVFNDRRKSKIIQESLDSYRLDDEDIKNPLGNLGKF